MGLATSSAGRVVLRQPFSDQVSASFLQEHLNAVFYLDEPAASGL
jgi:hypothetical protein